MARRTKRAWPEVYKRRAIQLREERLSVSQISARIGIPYTTVRLWVRHIEVEPRAIPRSPFRWSDSDRAEVKMLYTAGWSMGSASKFTGVPVATIADWLRADPDVVVRRNTGYTELPPKISHEEIDRIRRMYEVERMSTGEIAAKLGKHPTSIQKLLNRHGVKMRDRSERLKLRHERRRQSVVN